MHTAIVVGTRPSFIMAAPVIRAFDEGGARLSIVHTGQHYSDNMNAVFFEELGIRPPDVTLPALANAPSPGRQIAHILTGVEDWIVAARPDAVLVLGDTNSNLAAALAARKHNVFLGHIEAGERSGDLTAAEEQNRIIIDHIADVHFATNAKSRATLEREGVAPEKIHIVGNPIVDSLLQHRDRAQRLDLSAYPFASLLDGDAVVMTLHRQETVDDADILARTLGDIGDSARRSDVDVIFLAHPRTLARIKGFGLQPAVDAMERLHVFEGVGYLSFLATLLRARGCITDSGGVQQEACILGAPTITLMERTPWPETVEVGGNVLCRPGVDSILEPLRRIMATPRAASGHFRDIFGDGQTGAAIRNIVLKATD